MASKIKTSPELLSYSELNFSSDKFIAGSINRPRFLISHEIQHVKKIKVGSVAVPFSYYIVNSINQVFTFEETAGGGPVSFNITNGNYDIVTFPAEIKSQMDTASVNGYTYTVAINAITSKLDISTAAAFEIDLATSSGITGYTIATGSANSQSSTNVVNLSGSHNLYLRSNLAGSFLQEDTIVHNNELYNNILTAVPIDVNPLQVVNKDYDNTEYLDVDTHFKEVEFYFTDESGNIIDFNGQSFNVKLQIFQDLFIF